MKKYLFTFLLVGFILTNTTVHATAPLRADSVKTVALEEVSKYAGSTISTTGKVYSCTNMGALTIVQVGADFPGQLLTVILKADAKDAYQGTAYRVIQVKGKVTLYGGKPQIEVTDKNNYGLSGTE